MLRFLIYDLSATKMEKFLVSLMKLNPQTTTLKVVCWKILNFHCEIKICMKQTASIPDIVHINR